MRAMSAPPPPRLAAASVAGAVAVASLLPLLLGMRGCGPLWHFREVAVAVGIDHVHADPLSDPIEPLLVSGSAAAGDVDGDGYVDLYFPRGASYPNLLYRNVAGERFEVIDAGDASADLGTSGAALFADFDADGALDLIVSGLDHLPVVLRGLGDGRFEDRSADTDLGQLARPGGSMAAADYDGDGDLDLFLAHWGVVIPDGGSPAMLWRNDGELHFVDASLEAGLGEIYPVPSNTAGPPELPWDWSFTPNWTDLDGDGWPDLLVAGDFGTSRVLRNRGDGRFEDITPDSISDENGMGAALGDYDGDGDLDWFVSSIFDPGGPPGPDVNWGASGNRLYRNEGAGQFSDATDEAGVREGFWGWGSCFADFNADGRLDLFHTNGFPIGPESLFFDDPSRLFVAGRGNRRDRSSVHFREESTRRGLVDRGDGRGVVCFDYDRDGDVDVLVVRHAGPPALYRNELPPGRNSLEVRLAGPPDNPFGIGARVRIHSGTRHAPRIRAGARRGHVRSRRSRGRAQVRVQTQVQVREIRAGSNFQSQDPAEAHFGLGRARFVRHLEVIWPDGTVTRRHGLPANRLIEIAHPNAPDR